MKKMILFAAIFFSVFHLSAQNTGQTPVPADTTMKAPVDSAELYGFIPQRPIKVGGGPANQRQYLEALRDAQGKRVTYVRLGSCCPYPSTSPGAMFGGGMLDIYEITYKDAEDKKQKVSVYISFYDYEEPKPIKGFTFK